MWHMSVFLCWQIMSGPVHGSYKFYLHFSKDGLVMPCKHSSHNHETSRVCFVCLFVFPKITFIWIQSTNTQTHFLMCAELWVIPIWSDNVHWLHCVPLPEGGALVLNSQLLQNCFAEYIKYILERHLYGGGIICFHHTVTRICSTDLQQPLPPPSFDQHQPPDFFLNMFSVNILLLIFLGHWKLQPFTRKYPRLSQWKNIATCNATCWHLLAMTSEHIWTEDELLIPFLLFRLKY